MPYIYTFDHKHRKPPMDMKDLLGGKGANLAEMTSVLGLPVPAGFTITTDACRAYMAAGWPKGLDGEISKHLAALEKTMGRKLGDPVDPLLVSVSLRREVLDAGDDGHRPQPRVERRVGRRARQADRRRSVSRTTRTVVSSRCTAASCSTSMASSSTGCSRRRRSGTRGHRRRCRRDVAPAVRSVQGRRAPRDRQAVPAGSARAVERRHRGRVPELERRSAIAYRVRERISHDLGTAVNVQAMVFGNRDDNSGTGVGFTRNAATGENKPYGDFSINAQARMSWPASATPKTSTRSPSTSRRCTSSCRHLRQAREALPRHVRHRVHHRSGQALDAPERVGKRTGAAALRMAVEMTKAEGGRSPRRKRSSASPRTISSRCCTPISRVRTTRSSGRASPLRPVRRSAACTSPPTPRLVPPIAARRSSSCGPKPAPRTSTACRWPRGSSRRVVVWSATRRWWRAGGASRRLWVRSRSGSRGAFRGGRRGRPRRRRHFDRRIDRKRRARRGRALFGRAARSSRRFCPGQTTSAGAPAGAAQTPTTVLMRRTRRQFGAEGIGLCRTEHMFLGDDRLPIVRRMILADTSTEEEAALEELRVAQKADFEEILEAMDGLPVTVRLLDPPLHEFCRRPKNSRSRQRPRVSPTRKPSSSKRRSSGTEFNPMLGTRGVRLGVVKPGSTRCRSGR